MGETVQMSPTAKVNPVEMSEAKSSVLSVEEEAGRAASPHFSLKKSRAVEFAERDRELKSDRTLPDVQRRESFRTHAP